MKTDLNDIMRRRGINALLVTGPALNNPAMNYFTGNVHLGNADLVILPGQQPVLFCNPMERGEAAHCGFPLRNLAEYKTPELIKQTKGDPVMIEALRYQKMLEDLGFTKGCLSIYGEVEAGRAYSVFNMLQQLMPEIEIVGEMGKTALLEAMQTKDQDEADAIRHMGQITVNIVGRVAEYLQSHKAKEGVLVQSDGSPLTIGCVKYQIDLWAAELGVQNPHGVIFAIGYDSTIPHSTGDPSAVLALGRTIIFDIFLQQAGGGYHYDFTRTWCLGYAPRDARQLYDDVKKVYDHVMVEVQAGASFNALHELSNDLFEAQGHPTTRQDPLTTEGYVHSLGHGLGLYVHEYPTARDKQAVLQPGVVVTIEPGLYYPEKGIGCRIEDTFYVTPDGEIEKMAEYPYDLVLPVK